MFETTNQINIPGLVNKEFANLKIAIEIVDLPIKDGDFRWFSIVM